VWVVQRRQRASLAIEARATLGINEPDSRQDLDGDIATEPGVMRSIHFAHSAGAKQRVNGEGADLTTD
jgi:hypothetical protein